MFNGSSKGGRDPREFSGQFIASDIEFQIQPIEIPVATEWGTAFGRKIQFRKDRSQPWASLGEQEKKRLLAIAQLIKKSEMATVTDVPKTTEHSFFERLFSHKSGIGLA